MKQHTYSPGKVDYNGSGRRNCRAVLEWSLDNGRFSMSASIWNPRDTDIYRGGQCVDTVAAYFPENKKVQAMLRIWERWHLNDAKAGDAAQEAYLRAHPVNAVYPESHYEKASAVLAAAGLNPHDGYMYGHAWKTEELPPDVVAEINSWSEPT